MNTDRIEALLWARVDGTIEPEELAELEVHLGEHPKSREIERQIARITEGLGTLDRVPPPSELRDRINGALAHAASPAQTERAAATPINRFGPNWPTRWLPLAASLLIGVAIGFLLHPNTGGSIDPSNVTATIVSSPGQVEAGRVEIQLDDGAGRVVASRGRADVEVEVTVTTEIDVAVTLGSAAGPVRLESLISSNALATEVTPNHEGVVVRTVGPGTARISVVAIDAVEPVRLQVSSGGHAVEERWIDPVRNETKP